jgi:hypothetical protein
MLLTISLVFSIPMLISSPVTLLSAFMMVAVILYSWFSFKFYREVLQQQKIVKHRLRDWVKVNGIVTIVFSVLTILNVLLLLKNPNLFTDAIRSFGVEMHLKSITGFLYVMLGYGAILFIHVLWTFALLKKNKDYFI